MRVANTKVSKGMYPQGTTKAKNFQSSLIWIKVLKMGKSHLHKLIFKEFM